eukprot:Gregarina_sp_Poly_1__11066@NODE_88_length_15218_cov_183_340440_g76_i0_p9_GENE_NODE_88_length_15218_cov_183_340440_g76_i0NODE_88_length_15218_cov_183_340440_g76_i0_p9_ORF_typecomplete_len236_score28_71IL12p40_C/PF10420_9/3_8IL12p40_C/PF10420_9/2_2e02_NODE_88_length_15218_cov_183_340440_g76_i01089711604
MLCSFGCQSSSSLLSINFLHSAAMNPTPVPTGTFLCDWTTDKNELQELITLDKRLEGLVLSCGRLSIDFKDQASWTALLADFSAFTASCNLTTTAVLPKFFTRSVAPDHLPLDPNVFTEVPNLLSTKPDDEVSHSLIQFRASREHQKDKSALDWKATPFAESQLRRKIRVRCFRQQRRPSQQEQNNILEQASRQLASDHGRSGFQRKSQMDFSAGRYLTTAFQFEQERSKIRFTH